MLSGQRCLVGKMEKKQLDRSVTIYDMESGVMASATRSGCRFHRQVKVGQKLQQRELELPRRAWDYTAQSRCSMPVRREVGALLHRERHRSGCEAMGDSTGHRRTDDVSIAEDVGVTGESD